MSQQILIIVETSDIGAKYTAEAAVSLGLKPVFLCKLSNYQEDTLNQVKAYEHYDLDTGDPNVLYEFIRRKDFDVYGIITFLDSRLEVAVRLARIMNVHSLDIESARLKDKHFAQVMAPEHFPETFHFAASTLPIEKLRAMLDRFGSIVVKPRYTGGAIGYKRLTSNEDLDNLSEHIRATQIPSFLNPDLWMAQRYLEGTLVSLEGFSVAGRPTVLGVSGRQKIGNTETIISFPTEQKDVLAQKSLLIHRCQEFLKASRFRDGFFHIEMVVANDEALIIDPNVGRIGGGGLGEQLALAYGMAPTELYAQVIAISLRMGLPVDPRLMQGEPVHHTASVMYGISTAGFVQSVLAPPDLESFHTVIWGPGQLIDPQGINNWSWVGIVSGIVPTVYEEVKRLSIRTNAGTEQAVF